MPAPTPPDPPRACLSHEEALARILPPLLAAPRILLCGHVRADGDCLGSIVAMYRFLTARGKNVRVFFRGPLIEVLLDFLPPGIAPAADFPADFPADITLCLDAADPDRIVQGFSAIAPGLVINIDHHHTNPAYGHINWIDPAAAAVGEMIFALIHAARPDAWTPQIAAALFLAVATDTGGFRFGNTSARVLRVAAELVQRGADPCAVAEAVWENRRIETVRIEAAVMADLRFECDGRLVWAPLRQSTLLANGGEENEPDNLANLLRGIRGVRAAVLIRETPDGKARASFRSRRGVDVSAIAARLGGGGHPAAAPSAAPHAQRSRIER